MYDRIQSNRAGGGIGVKFSGGKEALWQEVNETPENTAFKLVDVVFDICLGVVGFASG